MSSLLKHIRNIKKKDSGISVPIIDEIRSVQEKGYGNISLAQIKEDASKLVETIEGFENGTVPRHEFFVLVQKIFFDTFLSYEGSGKEMFHPSSLYEDCSRKLYYDLTETPYSNKYNNSVSSSLQTIFDIGTIYHTYIQYLMVRAGLDVIIEAPIKSVRMRIDGKADALWTKIDGKRVLVEVKTAASFSYAKAKIRPIKKHIRQATVYAKKCGAEEILFIYINKDTQDIITHTIPVDEKVWEEMSGKMFNVLKHVKSKTPVERECATITSKKALSCPYATHCFKNL